MVAIRDVRWSVEGDCCPQFHSAKIKVNFLGSFSGSCQYPVRMLDLRGH